MQNSKLQNAKQLKKKTGHVGKGKKITCLGKSSQSKLIPIIAEELSSELQRLIRDCRAWATIADTIPDISKHEQLRLGARIVNKDGNVSEHFLFCTRVSSTTTQA